MNSIFKNIRLFVLPIACWLSATFVMGQPADTLSLVFVGDLMQHQTQINAAKVGKNKYSYEGCFDYVAPELRRADLAIGNLEVTFGGQPYRGYPAFSAPDEYLQAISKAGFNLLLLANNHCLDRGNRGAERTLHLLDSMKIMHTGVFRDAEERLHQYPLLVERKGFRLVFLNYTYGTNGLRPASPLYVNYIDRGQIRKDVMKARMMCPDVIIACMHWGIEYEVLPRKGEREMAAYLLSLGVDHVIGGHPHVVQPLEVVVDSVTPSRHLVAYSLGNFVSNMSARYTDGGMVVKMVLKKVAGRTRMVDCGYSYVWTSRPSVNRKGKFYVCPSGLLCYEGDKIGDENENSFLHTGLFLEKMSTGEKSLLKGNLSDAKKKCNESKKEINYVEKPEFNINCLNMNEKTHMSRYLDAVRKVVAPHAKGIKEYFF